MDKGIFDFQARIQKSALVDEGKLSRRQGLQFSENNWPTRATRQRMGKIRQDVAHRARFDGRQSEARRNGLRRRSAAGHNANIASGFQGQRQWTDYQPGNGDFLEAILNTSFDWNGQRSRAMLLSRRKMIVSTVLRCCSVICSPTPRRFLPTCGLTGVLNP